MQQRGVGGRILEREELQGALLDELRLGELGVRQTELLAVMSVAQFEARISVPVAMKVDVETFAVLRDDRLLRGLDEALEILPGLFG